MVAMADVLGFKDAIMGEGTLQLANRYKALLSKIENTLYMSDGTAQILASTFRGREKTDAEPEIEYEIFSDTIVLWTRPIDFRAMEDFGLPLVFLDCIRELLLVGFADRLPLRVGIGYGESIMERKERIFVGKALLDAHETEKMQEWVGVSFHPNCIKALREWQDCFYNLSEQGLLLEYHVPCKCESRGLELHWSMDWFLEWHRAFKSEDLIRQHFNMQISKAKDYSAKKKWDNAIKFFQTCEELDYYSRQNVQRNFRSSRP